MSSHQSKFTNLKSLLDRPAAPQLLPVFSDLRWPRPKDYMRDDLFSSVQTRRRITLVIKKGPVG